MFSSNAHAVRSARISRSALCLSVLLATSSLIGCRFHGGAQSDTQDDHTSNTPDQSLMNPAEWEPAGTRLSTEFISDRADWIQTGTDIWTLPGMSVPRSLVQRSNGTQLPNHQQFSVATRREFGALKLTLEFRFEPEDITTLPLSWFGNSGIFLAGLYEIQIFNAGAFLKDQLIDPERLHAGMLKISDGTREQTIAPNRLLCGAVYGGGIDGDPLAGTPVNSTGQMVNACTGMDTWHLMEITFQPPAFDANGQKTRPATVEVLIDGIQLLFGGKDSYAIPGPTGSQSTRSEQARGPLILQDHGSRVSFRNIRVREI